MPRKTNGPTAITTTMRSVSGLMGTKDTISNVAAQEPLLDTGRMKRTVQVNVKMTEEDFALLRKAAEKRWPDAVITNSGIVLALARIAARETLATKETKRREKAE
jgi:hypothetical protein